ncbi:MAG: ABC transporter ATP-binding protein [Hyphomicrobiales bacterium]|nr:ABC transporter ATP-binding protein [Hyphomicrobiales bacterium]PCJ84437.1 MAG: ABC transporter ATP-binding protein [Hyphomicrobiales bacterium]
MAEISLQNVTKKFAGVRAVNDVSITLKDGEFFVLLGPTGAGKTTLLRLISGLETLDEGQITIEGVDASTLSVAERDVAMVFQYYSLYPRYNVRENLEFPLRAVKGRYSEEEINNRVNSAAKMLHIEPLMDRKTDKLSGGEMQRVSVGRAIVREPTVFLMDEPLSNLDAKLKESLRLELKELQVQLKATFLFVTHDQIEAMSMGDRIGVLQDGKLVQVGKPHDVYNSPYNTFVAGFIGSPAMNLIPAMKKNGVAIVDGAFELKLDDKGKERIGKDDGPITLGIRSEDINIGDTGIAATVYHIENQGVEKIITLRAGETFFKATVPAAYKIAIDDEIKCTWNQVRLHGFDTKTGINHTHS